MPRPSKGAFYAVAKGRVPGVYSTWDECKAQVEAFPGAKYKKLGTLADAEAWAKSIPAIAAPAAVPRILAPAPPTMDAKGRLIVYTDGACGGNGQRGSKAGIGVWWGRNDTRNLSERCPGDQTNNRAELIAIVRALETAPEKPLLIKTDSQYSIKCLTEWLQGWERKNWKNSKGEPVKNAPLIRYASALRKVRQRNGNDVEVEYVKGHAGHEGNEGADRLAVAGSLLPEMPDDRDWDTLAEKLLQDVEDTVRARRLEKERLAAEKAHEQEAQRVAEEAERLREQEALVQAERAEAKARAREERRAREEETVVLSEPEEDDAEPQLWEDIDRDEEAWAEYEELLEKKERAKDTEDTEALDEKRHAQDRFLRQYLRREAYEAEAKKALKEELTGDVVVDVLRRPTPEPTEQEKEWSREYEAIQAMDIDSLDRGNMLFAWQFGPDPAKWDWVCKKVLAKHSRRVVTDNLRDSALKIEEKLEAQRKQKAKAQKSRASSSAKRDVYEADVDENKPNGNSKRNKRQKTGGSRVREDDMEDDEEVLFEQELGLRERADPSASKRHLPPTAQSNASLNRSLSPKSCPSMRTNSSNTIAGPDHSTAVIVRQERVGSATFLWDQDGYLYATVDDGVEMGEDELAAYADALLSDDDEVLLEVELAESVTA
ncbi:hypothetical protein CERSUDRAFT_82283 [Gelatoporia subvermispora B]|uniref:ribonuclease H n=1 Tax=Ceriporiopsis subvermispora (strain B) TaxID=914234 RepID=M2QLY7_CERS8|nr:hypothetical protein CERSUDRAFT_82283 [Gelatoporia subvermispora B]